MILLGAHISIGGGYRNAVVKGSELGCSAVQIFTRNQLRWKSSPLRQSEIIHYQKVLQENDSIKIIFAHGSYLFNFCSSNKRTVHLSKRSILDELDRCARLNLPYLVIHPGAHLGMGEQAGVEKIIIHLTSVLKKYEDETQICVETTAGQGTNLGFRFEHIRDIIHGIGDGRIGVCLDTCHIFAAGYDLRTSNSYHATIELFDKIVGLANLRVIHLNDSKGFLGSRLDRHEHIGRGALGRRCFEYFMNDVRFEKIPKVIETPKKLDHKDMDSINLEVLRQCIHY
jgi:deoxyribonuclease-4